MRCDEKDVDRYGRIVGECFVNLDGAPVSANGLMVIAGHAVAYRRYSKDFVAAEAAARAEKRGVWQGEFEMPWDWRRRH